LLKVLAGATAERPHAQRDRKAAMHSVFARIVMAVGLGASAAWTAGAPAVSTSHTSTLLSLDAPRVLVVGDSTAAGTGAAPSMSVAARLAQAFPDARVDNRGQDGAVLDDVRGQLESDEGPRPRLLLVMAGGNDIFRLSSVATIERELDRLLIAAVGRADHVVLLTPGNLATAPGLWWPFNHLLGWRSRSAHEAFERAARRHAVVHVSMLREPAEDPFALDPARHYAGDGIHPSADGYAVWYETLRGRTPLSQWLNP